MAKGAIRTTIKRKHLAFIDWQLQLPNNLKLDMDLHEVDIIPSIIIFELESLQEINQTYGRNIGDQLLIDIRDYFFEHNDDETDLYRVSGNKFVITSYNKLKKPFYEYAVRLCNRLATPWNITSNEQTRTVTCKVTMTAIAMEFFAGTDEEMMVIAERSLQIAKGNEDVLLLFNESLYNTFKRRRKFELSLKSCVTNGMKGFSVFYQPIANAVTGVWCGVEALCRWASPELGDITPDEFIAESERLHLIDTIGLWILETAIKQCKDWGLDAVQTFMLTVNTSAFQLKDAQLAVEVLAMLKRHQYPAEKLCLEITDSTQFTFNESAMSILNTLRDAGVSISLDDFGSRGYSAFDKLRELPVDIIKIERVFVADIENDEFLQHVFQAVAGIMHNAKIQVIAAGVETSEQMNILYKNGADMLQGFLFSKPLNTQELTKNINRFKE